MKNQSLLRLPYIFLLGFLMISLGIATLWILSKTPESPFPNKEFYLLLSIYVSLLITFKMAFKRLSLMKCHQIIGFSSCQFKYLFIAFTGTLILWIIDYLLMTHLFEINISKEANYWFIKNQNTPLWSVFLTMCLLAPVIEEMLFRGALLVSLKNYVSNFWIIFISALIFVLVHVSIEASITLLIAGIFYAWIRIVSKSLWPSILAHILNNTITFIYYLNLSYH